MKILYLKTLVLCCSLGVLGLSTNQPTKKAEFEISVNFKKDNVEFNNVKGCHFSNLAFNASRSVTINQDGMRDAKNKNQGEIAKSNFVIGYTKRGETVTFKGIKGVSWKELTYNDDGKTHWVNQDGKM